ncbi:MAG TPA: DUF2797 domain-containing protein [Methanomassiliicoccales archaeon]|nr:DUF2797 domain-containing protein [Methanomassiliicoccales archaeon]
MFVRADRLLNEKPDWFSKHVLGYHWEGFVPHLELYDIEKRELAELDLRRLNIVVSDVAVCVGKYDEGSYRPCPGHVRLQGGFAQCPSCAETWIPVQECLFEPRCNGEECDCHFCAKEHLVYVAFHGRKTKIGMTGGTRLIERGIEQGADAIAPLMKVRGRKAARELEKEIARTIGATQRITASDFLGALETGASDSHLKDEYDAILQRLSPDHELLDAPLNVLDEYPMNAIDRPPQPAELCSAHLGKTIGIKGRFLIYESVVENELRLLDLASLPSLLIEAVEGVIYPQPYG